MEDLLRGMLVLFAMLSFGSVLFYFFQWRSAARQRRRRGASRNVRGRRLGQRGGVDSEDSDESDWDDEDLDGDDLADQVSRAADRFHHSGDRTSASRAEALAHSLRSSDDPGGLLRADSEFVQKLGMDVPAEPGGGHGHGGSQGAGHSSSSHSEPSSSASSSGTGSFFGGS